MSIRHIYRRRASCHTTRSPFARNQSHNFYSTTWSSVAEINYVLVKMWTRDQATLPHTHITECERQRGRVHEHECVCTPIQIVKIHLHIHTTFCTITKCVGRVPVSLPVCTYLTTPHRPHSIDDCSAYMQTAPN